MHTQTRCEPCNGTGSTVADTCSACGGQGRATEEATLHVRIPAGADNSRPLRLRGQGSVGSHGGPSGDVLVHVEVAPHPLLRRQDRDLEMDLPLTLSEAVEGAQVEVPVVTGSGSIRVRVPAGASNGARLRVPGKGIQTQPPGDLFLVLRPQTPQVPPDRAEEAARLARELESLAGAREVRAGLQL
jgi:molecular chaperone DnaJ